MGQHATIHVKTAEEWNGQPGKWLPAAGNAAGQLELALLSGELTQFNRLAGGAIVNYKVVTSDATGLNIANGPAILYGIINIAAGTMAAVYNSTTATGDILIPSATATTTFNGIGIICDQGITCDWTSGTWLVLYA